MRLHCFSAGRHLCLLILFAASAGSAQAQDVPFGPITVPATAVIFDPDNALSADQLAALKSAGPLSPVPAVKAASFAAGPGQTISFAAAGSIGCCSVAQVGPDGYAGSSENILGIGGISGFNSQNGMALVGVFTNGNPSGAAPQDYDYSKGTGQLSFSPVLNQVFFIGDGVTGTGSGAQQIFNVPPAATELWLGFVDGGTFRGPPQNYGDNPGSVSVRGTLATTDCSQQAAFDPDKVAILRNLDLTSNAGQTNAIEPSGYLFVYTGYRLGGKVNLISSLIGDPGISVDIAGSISAKPGVPLPAGFVAEEVQNLVRWHGNAVYGEGVAAKTEYPAIVADRQSTPLFDGVYPQHYADSPDISVPIVDGKGLPLTEVCYEKDFKTYIGCQAGSDTRFHTMGVFTWAAHYCGTVKVDLAAGSSPTSANANFTPTTKFAVTYTHPTVVQDSRAEVPFLSPKACLTGFVDFDGNVTSQCR